jgi:hypothetical protein
VFFFLSEEINKKLKSKNDGSKIESDDDPDNDIKPKSNLFDNNIYAEDDEDDYRPSTNHRKQINASKQKETQHSKSLQVLVEERKKKQGKIRNSIKLNISIYRCKNKKTTSKIR